jgi:hypothetical protein
MRQRLRVLLLTLTVLLVPAANAIDMHCFPGVWKYSTRQGWYCEVSVEPDCVLCFAVIVVEG